MKKKEPQRWKGNPPEIGRLLFVLDDWALYELWQNESHASVKLIINTEAPTKANYWMLFNRRERTVTGRDAKLLEERNAEIFQRVFDELESRYASLF